MRFRRLTAATLALTCLVFLAFVGLAAGGRPRGEARKHLCSVTDKQFIQSTAMNMSSLQYWSDSLLHGEANPNEVIREATDAATRVGATAPQDPSLDQTRVLVRAMLVEYARAVRAEVRGKSAGTHMLRAYQLANIAHDILLEAQTPLAARGCDVSPLL